MLGINKEIDELILSILKTKNTRFLRAIPFLIYLHKPNLIEIYNKSENKKLFGEIITITQKIFNKYKITITLPKMEEKIKLNYDEFEQEFELQKKRFDGPNLLFDKEKIYAERSLQMHLSNIFTKKEKDIINKIFENKALTKTEYEYYSRKTKKKLNAIINLQDITKALLPIHPKL